jgi:hypothetical protein
MHDDRDRDELRRNVSPPKLKVAPGRQGDVVLDARAPGYDPTRLSNIFSAGQIFEAEPRDETWARRVEASIGQEIVSDLQSLLPELSGLNFECRTRTCRLRWVGPRAAAEKVNRVTRELHPAAVHGFGPDTMYLIYGGGVLADYREVGDLIAWFERQRRLGLDQLRSDHEFFRRAGLSAQRWPRR